MELSNLNPISFADADAETVKTEIIKNTKRHPEGHSPRETPSGSFS